jgi:hypothetical protein
MTGALGPRERRCVLEERPAERRPAIKSVFEACRAGAIPKISALAAAANKLEHALVELDADHDGKIGRSRNAFEEPDAGIGES